MDRSCQHRVVKRVDTQQQHFQLAWVIVLITVNTKKEAAAANHVEAQVNRREANNMVADVYEKF